MSERVERAVANHDCTLCKLHRTADEVCETGFGPSRAEVMVVSKMPNSKKYQDVLETELEQAGLSPNKIFYASALKCKTFEQDASKTDLKTCRQYLEAEIALVKPKFILALGNEALFATTGHSGIMKDKWFRSTKLRSWPPYLRLRSIVSRA